MAIDLKSLDEVQWYNSWIPVEWYSFLYHLEIKYGIKIAVEKQVTAAQYAFIVTAGNAFYYAPISSTAKLVEVQECLYEVIYKMNLKPITMPTATATTTSSPYAIYYNPFIGASEAEAKKAAPSSGMKSAIASKNAPLNSLYEMYGMVDPKPARFCAKHRPTVDQVLAQIRKEEEAAEVAKTIANMSPALKDAAVAAFGKLALDYWGKTI